MDGLVLVLSEPGGDLNGRMTGSWGWELAEPDGRLRYMVDSGGRASGVSYEALRSSQEEVRRAHQKKAFLPPLPSHPPDCSPSTVVPPEHDNLST